MFINLVADIRHYLGAHQRIEKLIRSVEDNMASAAEQINAVIEKLDDVAADVAVLKTKAGQLDAEGQEALDRLSAKLDSLDAEVGDQDGSDEPPVEEPGDEGTALRR